MYFLDALDHSLSSMVFVVKVEGRKHQNVFSTNLYGLQIVCIRQVTLRVRLVAATTLQMLCRLLSIVRFQSMLYNKRLTDYNDVFNKFVYLFINILCVRIHYTWFKRFFAELGILTLHQKGMFTNMLRYEWTLSQTFLSHVTLRQLIHGVTTTTPSMLCRLSSTDGFYSTVKYALYCTTDYLRCIK